MARRRPSPAPEGRVGEWVRPHGVAALPGAAAVFSVPAMWMNYIKSGCKRHHHKRQRRPSSCALEEVREKELELERDLEECRPLSDGSSYERQLAVRMRDKVAKLQRPLTRYLPIRSETLNLRNHIESAGHQIELCPHVSVDSTSCRGYLQKMGSKFHHWNKRWFVFDRTKRLFSYYSDRSEKKHRGGAYFQAIEEVYVDHMNSVKSPSPNLTFVVKTNERTYHLMAPSPEATRIWVDVIFTGAEGYQEFEHGS